VNRSELVRTAMIWDAVAGQAIARARVAREELADQAKAELAEQGTAVTWRLLELATVTLPVSHETIVVNDRDALLKWTKARHPDEVEHIEQVRAAFLIALPLRCHADADYVCDNETGEVVPGLVLRAGGQPGTLSIRALPDAKRVLADVASNVLESIAAAMTEPHDEIPDGGTP